MHPQSVQPPGQLLALVLFGSSSYVVLLPELGDLEQDVLDEVYHTLLESLPFAPSFQEKIECQWRVAAA